MQAGALGVSTSLEYAPAPYASTDELIALTKEAARFGGIDATHMRNEGDGEMAALDEAIRIGREARIPVEIWHLKVAGKNNWGKMREVIARINQARREGVDVTADTYAYTAWFNSRSAFIPPWAHDGGDARLIERLKNSATRARIRKDMETPSQAWDNEWQEIRGPEDILVAVVNKPPLMLLQGKRISEIAANWHEDSMDAIFDLLIKDNAQTHVAVFGMSEPDVALALEQPWVSVCNDSSGKGRPGCWAPSTLIRVPTAPSHGFCASYVREEHKLTLEDAIRKFSALPAERMHLADRGVLKQGMWADMVVFDPAKVRDLATYDNPNQLSVGMEYVLVNGVPVVDHGQMTNALPGRVIRGSGSQVSE